MPKQNMTPEERSERDDKIIEIFRGLGLGDNSSNAMRAVLEKCYSDTLKNKLLEELEDPDQW